MRLRAVYRFNAKVVNIVYVYIEALHVIYMIIHALYIHYISDAGWWMSACGHNGCMCVCVTDTVRSDRDVI